MTDEEVEYSIETVKIGVKVVKQFCKLFAAIAYEAVHEAVIAKAVNSKVHHVHMFLITPQLLNPVADCRKATEHNAHFLFLQEQAV
jgi:hypothetical protein